METRRQSHLRVFVRMCVVALLCLSALAGSGAASVQAANPPALGISFWSEGDTSGQCQQTTAPGAALWTTAGNWTYPITINTTDRAGACRFAIGIKDFDNSLQNVYFGMNWQVQPGGDAGQCWDMGGYTIPIGPSLNLTRPIGMDMDTRSGWCNLSFYAFGRSDVELNIVFSGPSDTCYGTGYLTVRSGLPPVSLGIDTDNGYSSCSLQFRLRQL